MDVAPHIADRVTQARYAYERRAGAARQLAADGLRLEARVAELTAAAEKHDKTCKLLTSLGEQAQQQAQDKLEQLVTRGLQVIFGTDLSFHVVQSVKANQAVTEFVIRSEVTGSDGAVHKLDTPVLEARGGGMAAVTGFMIRLVILLLTPGARRILFLDETFGFVSEEYETRLAEFLAEVARQAGVQIFLVTHSRAYEEHADARYRLEQKNGVTVLA